MKKTVMHLWIFLATACLPLLAAEIAKQNNTEPLNTGASWVGGSTPTAADEALWNSTVTAANSSALTNAVTWNGIKVTNPGGAVTITGAGVLTLDGGAAIDINMAAAAQNLTIGAPLALLSNLQEMDILSGRTLRLAGPVSVAVIGGSWIRKGTGTLILDGPVSSAVSTTLELQKGTTVLTGAGGGLNFPSTGGRIYVGRQSGGDAILIISNGVHATGSTSADATANFVGVGARGRLFMEGGSLSVNYLRCGINGGSTFPSEIRVNNGRLEAAGGAASGVSSYALMIGNNHEDSPAASTASGILTVNGGQAVFTNGVIKLGSENSTSTGAQAVNLNGGELAMRQFNVGASVLVPKTVTLNGGLLRVTAAGTLFTGAGVGNGTLSVNVGDGGAIIDTDAADVTLTPPLLGAGSGGLMKLGSGTLLLTGASTYTGKTRVLGGRVGFGGAAAALTPDLAVVSGAGLTLRDGALTAFAPAALSIGGVSSSALELELAADGSANDVLVIPAGAAVGALAVSPVIQGTTSPVLLVGDYDIMTYAGTAPDVSRFAVVNQAPGRTYEFILNAGPKTVTLRIGYGTAESLWIAPGSGAWETAANWSTLPANEPGTLTRFDSMISVPATVTAASPVTVGGMTFDSALSYTLAGGGYTLDNGGSPAYINVDRGAHAVSGGLTLAGALEVSVPSGTQLTLDGVVDGGGQLVKNGAGELWLGGVNAYSGGSRLKSGSVILDNGGTVGTGPVSAEGASGFRITGAAPAVFSNDLNLVNSFTFNTQDADLSLRGAVDWQGTGRVLTKAGPFDLFLDVDINETGSGRFKVDQGTLRFRNGHTYYVAQSERDTIQMVNNNNSSRTVMIEAGATVDISGIYMEYGMTNRVVVQGGALNLRGGGSSQDVCLLRANGAGYDEFVVNGGQVTAGAATWFSIGVRGGQAALGALVINAGTTTLGRVSLGVRAESGAFDGNGRVVLNGGLLEVAALNWMADSASGRTNVVTLGSGTPGVGTLRLPATLSSAYGAANQAIMIFNGGTLEATGLASYGSSSLADYLYGAKQVRVAAGGARIDTCGLDIAIAQNLNSGSASDGGLTKLGEGALTLTGTCGFSGPVTVAQGALVLPATVASTGLVVAAGAELVLANGTIQTLAPDAVALASGAKLTFEAMAGGSGCDRMDLPAGASVGDLSIAVVKQGTAMTVTAPGDYVIFTFAGSAPVISGWTLRNPPGGRTATFVIDGTSVLLRLAYEAGAAIWTTDGSGAWESAGNWTTPPGNAAGAAVFLDDAITSPATVTLAGGATLGYLGFNNPLAYTVAGAALTLSHTNGLDAVVAVASGVHTVASAISASGNLRVQAGAASGVAAAGGITAVGTLTVAGPGSLAVADAAALAVNDLLLQGGGELIVTNTTALTLPVALGAGGGVVSPAAGRTVDLQGVVSGSGALTKAGSSFLMVTNANATYSGKATVKGGTLRIDTLPSGGFGLGQGTLHTVGANATTVGGYTLDTRNPARAAVLRADNNITLQGAVNALSGALVKTGAGTVSFTATGENVFSADNGAGSSQAVLNIGANGDSPTVGFGGFSIADGKVVLGAAGQTNRFNGPVVVGLNSTTNADAETAGTLEISGGVTTLNSDLIVGQSNGSTTTAPVARASKLSLTDGELSVQSLILGRATVAAAHNSAPELEVSGGLLTVNGACYIPEQTGAKATVTLSGGKLNYLAGTAVSLRFGQRGEANVTVSGTAELFSGLSIFLGVDAGSKATLQLDGGIVTARNLDSGSSGEGHVIFNGGTLRPTQNNDLLATLNSATVSAGGAVLDLSLVDGSTLKKTLRHDAALGGADGGLTKIGAGTLTIGTVQAYDGPTVVSEGVLSLPGSGLLSNVTALAVSPGATLLLNPAAVQSLALGGLTLGSPAAAPAKLTLSFAPDGSAYDVLAVNGSALLGDVALTLQRVGENDDFALNGTYSLITYTGAAPAVTGLTVANSLYGKKYTFAAGSGAVTLTISADTTGGSYVWTAAGGGTWENSGNWALAPGAGGAGQPVRFDDAALAPATVTVSSSVTLGEAYFNNANGYTLSGSTAMAFDNGGTQALVAVESGSHVLALPVSVASSGLRVESASGAGLTLAGNLSGNGALVKSGAGTLTAAAGSSRSGITQLLAGTLVIDGAGSTGSGELVLDGGIGISSGTTGPATLANRVTLKSGAPVINTAANDLTLSGPLEWQSTVLYLYKTGTNTLTLAGSGGGVAAVNPKLLLREGGLRFAAGADYSFDGQTRESLKMGLDPNKSTSVVVEEGANLVLGGISMTAASSGVANNASIMTQEGGSVELKNTAGDSGNAFFLRELGTAPSTYVMNGGTFDMPQSSWANAGIDGPAYLVVNGGSMELGRFAAGYQTRTTSVGKGLVDVTVNSGRLSAAGSWSWMSDGNARTTVATVNGGVLALPATQIYGVNTANWTDLKLNGGTLEAAGAALDSTATADWLKGARRVALGAQGGTFDTRGYAMGVVQSVQALSNTGGLAKVGAGTLTLAGTNVLWGLVDAREGTLRARLAHTDLPGTPLFWLRMDNGAWSADSSGHALSVITDGSGFSAYADRNATLNALNFNGSGNLRITHNAIYPATTAFTVSAWVHLSAFVGSTQSILSGRYNADRTFEFKLNDTGELRLLEHSTGTWWQDIRTVKKVSLNQWTHVAAVISQAGAQLYINGVPEAMKYFLNPGLVDYSGVGWPFPGDIRLVPPASTYGLLVGRSTTTAVRFAGRLDDVMLFDRVLNAAEVAQLAVESALQPLSVRAASTGILDLMDLPVVAQDVSGSGQILGDLTVVGGLAAGDSAAEPAGAELWVEDLTLGANVVYECALQGDVNDLIHVAGHLTVDGAGVIDFGHTAANPVVSSFTATVMTYDTIAGDANFAGWSVTGLGRTGYDAAVEAVDGEVVVSVVSLWGTLIIVR